MDHHGHDMMTHDMGAMDHGHHSTPMPSTGMHVGMDHGSMNHGSMNHGDMNHGDMNHGDMNHGSMMDHMMKMWFHLDTSGTVLFEGWKFSTAGGLVASMVGIFFMAALYEGLKYYREYLFWRTYNALQYKAVTIPEKNVVDSEENQIVHVVGEVIHKQPPTMWSLMHVFQTGLHMVQMVLSYFLMLIFMTYNTYLCIALVLGAGLGYFLFGWKKSVIVDVTEHCH